MMLIIIVLDTEPVDFLMISIDRHNNIRHTLLIHKDQILYIIIVDTYSSYIKIHGYSYRRPKCVEHLIL